MLLACMVTAVLTAPDPLSLHRWHPTLPVPARVIETPFAGDPEEGMALESLAGLAARAVLRDGYDTLLWEDLENDGYQRWYADYLALHAPRVEAMDLDAAVRALQSDGVVRGYILYSYDQSERPLHASGPRDESANVATTLAARHGAIVVSERLEDRCRALGLRRLLDARGMTEDECLTTYGEDLATDVLCLADPKTRNVRSLAIALDSMVVSGGNEAYARALARCEPDSPVLGWGCGGEDELTIPSSRAGLFQTATNWCHNLPVFLTESPADPALAPLLARRDDPIGPPDLDWGEGKHFVNFTITDGDNIQWLMGNFVGGSEAPMYYGCPERGAIPFGWGLPAPGLAQLSPRTLAEVLGAATSADDFILYSGGGYFYPDLYGADRPEADALALHARRLRGYMDLTGIRVLAFNFIDWDSPEALAACETLAKNLPGLLGILAFQYHPYSAGEGRVVWVDGAEGDRVPVISCRMTIWARTGGANDAAPAAVAARLGELPRAASTDADDAFSWVLVHAWSYFRQPAAAEDGASEDRDVPQDGSEPGTARGYRPALWAAERLGPSVQACGVEELVWRVRLRLDARRTLLRWARESGDRSLIERVLAAQDSALPDVFREIQRAARSAND